MGFSSSEEVFEKMNSNSINSLESVFIESDPVISLPALDISKDNLSPIILESFLYKIKIIEQIIEGNRFLPSETGFVFNFLTDNLSITETARSRLKSIQKVSNREKQSQLIKLFRNDLKKKIDELKSKIVDQICEANFYHPNFASYLNKISNKIDKDILLEVLGGTTIVSSHIKPNTKSINEGFHKIKGYNILFNISFIHNRVDILERLQPTAHLFVEGILEMDSIGRGDFDVSISDETIKSIFTNSAYISSIRPSFEIIKGTEHRLEDLVLPEGIYEHIRNLCNQHRALDEKGIKTKLSFLLKGPPGTGKTHCAYAIGNLLGKNIISVNLGEKTQQEYAMVNKIMNLIHRAEIKNEILLFDECDSILGYNAFTGNSDAWAKKIFEKFKGVAIFTTNYNVPYGFERRVDYIGDFSRPSKKARATILTQQIKKMSDNLDIDKIPTEKEIEEVVCKYPITGGYYNQIVKLALSLSPQYNEINQKNLLESFEYFYSKIPNSFKDEEEDKEAKIKIKSVKLNEDLEEETASLLRYTRNKNILQKSNPLLPAGVTAIFSGPPGTGKTILAEAIANELNLTFKKVTPSSFLSMWVGQTEQNIKKVFKEAQNKNQLLFIDEAEGLFLDREGSTKSWERTQVDELLQQVESFPGVLIIATNHKDMMDEAFSRRFLFHFRFSLPDEKTRVELWRSWEKDLFLSEQEISLLAKTYELSGGEIRNVVVQAIVKGSTDIISLSQLCENAVKNKTGKAKRKMGL